MPRLRIIYGEDDWALHHQARTLQKYAPADFDVSLATLGAGRRSVEAALGDTEVDLVLLLVGTRTQDVRSLLRQRAWRSKLVAAWTAGVPRCLGVFTGLYDAADAWVINNRDLWEVAGRLPRTYPIANGVDLDVFSVHNPPETRTPKVLWTGSERHLGIGGYDNLVVPLQKRLHQHGIACELLLIDACDTDQRTPAQMAEWYNSGTVFLCASASEDTPNSALEAAACGCTVVSTRVGNMPELIRSGVNGYLVDRSFKVLVPAILNACANYVRLSRAMQEDIRAWHWVARSPEYFRVFREALAPPAATPRLDLSDAVTVFVTTVGAPTFATCLDCLNRQDCSFRLQIIDHVAPMNVAFQRMLDECRTPYYVQVDEDMLLYPHAVRTLHETIDQADPRVALYVADLYDAHVARSIHGVKIFRHDIVRRFPLQRIDAFETAQLDQLAQAGYVISKSAIGVTPVPVAGRTLGLHGTQWTLLSVYERYTKLERRRRAYPDRQRWFADYHAVFLERFLEEPSAENFFALMGIIAGTLTSAHGAAPAKDYRTYETLPGFGHLTAFLQELEQAKRVAPDGCG